MVWTIMPDFDGICDTGGDAVWAIAGGGKVGLELFNKRELIEDVFHCLFLSLGEEAF